MAHIAKTSGLKQILIWNVSVRGKICTQKSFYDIANGGMQIPAARETIT